jgi:hypothetical protein
MKNIKIKNKKVLKNGAIAGYVYYNAENKWKWRIIGNIKKGGSRNNNNSQPPQPPQPPRLLPQQPSHPLHNIPNLNLGATMAQAQQLYYNRNIFQGLDIGSMYENLVPLGAGVGEVIFRSSNTHINVFLLHNINGNWTVVRMNIYNINQVPISHPIEIDENTPINNEDDFSIIIHNYMQTHMLY